MKLIENQSFDLERAFYDSHGLQLKNCRFDGPADGESAFKECSDITVQSCFFNLRYPFWHCDSLSIEDCELTGLCRAALWYSRGIRIDSTRLHGIKALRECRDITMKNCDIISPEFGWSSEKLEVTDCTAESEYFMLRARDCRFYGLTLKGKYSFQYAEDSVFESCILDTKDAFWHGKSITVKNSVVKGEYLGWYSENLTFINCKIIGTQPLCYCKNLRLIDCELIDTDLAFEKSEVEATVKGHIVSVKNPLCGTVIADSFGEIIMDDKKAKGICVLR